MKVRIMGIDAAFSNIGLAMTEVDLTDPKNPVITVTDLHLIHTEGVKKRPKGVPRSSDDLRRARESLIGIHKKIVEWQPHYIVAEVPFGSQSARASWALGIAIGVLSSIPGMIEVTPREVKTATGEPHADKEEMITWAMDKHPDAPWAWRKYKGALISVSGTNEHLADAVATVYAGLKTQALKERLAGRV